MLLSPGRAYDGLAAQDLPAEGAVREGGQRALVANLPEVLAGGGVAEGDVGILCPDQRSSGRIRTAGNILETTNQYIYGLATNFM